MKELILILLIIFASLAFGADNGAEALNIPYPGAKIQLPYTYEKDVAGLGKVTGKLHAGPAIDEMTLEIYASCVDKKSGKLSRPRLVDTQMICEYSSEVYEPAGNVVTFQFRKSLIAPGHSQCNSGPRMSFVELSNYCANR